VADAASIDSGLEPFESLDILVNLTTFTLGRSLDEASPQDWTAGLNVSLTGAMLLSRAAAARMKSRGGSIVHFGSMYGLVSPDPRLYEGLFPANPPDYGAAKAAVLQLSRYQAVFWAADRIRVNAVVPGPFPNPSGQGAAAEFASRLADRVPMGRVGRAEEITGAVIYLASDAASYVTGTSLVVDGGWTAW
jgi:gluconate 5-dehydrogenase